MNSKDSNTATQSTQPKYDSLNLNNKTILITGAAGFIGSNLVDYFATYHPNCNILALDCFRDNSFFDNGNPSTLGHFNNLKLYKNVEILPINIADTNAMRKAFYQYGKIDYIFHKAAISDTTCQNMNLVMNVNLNTFRELIRLAVRHEAHIIYASSAATYGLSQPPNSVGQNENPANIYGYSKLCMDRENARAQAELQDSGTGLIGLRYFNVYGRNEFYKGKTASMVLQLALQAHLNKEVKLFEFGEQQRDFVYIEDVIQANLKALELVYLTYGASDDEKHRLEWQKIHRVFNDASMPKEPPLHEMILRKIYGADFKNLAKNLMESWQKNGAIYNVGYGASCSFNDIINILKEQLGGFEVSFIKNNYAFFQNHTLADSNNFLPNYKPAFDLESGIKDYMPYIESIFNDIKDGRKVW